MLAHSMLNRSKVLGICALSVMVGCSPEPTSLGPLVAKQSSAVSNSPEAVFRGVMLGEGPVADAVPEIASEYKMEMMVSPYLSLSYLQSLHDRIVGGVNSIDPSFMAEFRVAVVSGDPSIISQALDDASRIILEAMKTMPEGEALQYYANNPAQVESELAGRFDAAGVMDIGDTLVTLSQTTAQVTSTSQVGYGGGGGGGSGSGCPTGICQTRLPGSPGGVDEPANGPPEPTGKPSEKRKNSVVLVDPSAIQPRNTGYAVTVAAVVYVAGAVHVILVYNAAVVIFQGLYVAFDVPKWFPGGSWKRGPQIKKEQLIYSIAQSLGT